MSEAMRIFPRTSFAYGRILFPLLSSDIYYNRAWARSHPYRGPPPALPTTRASRVEGRERPGSGLESRFQFDITDAVWRGENIAAPRFARCLSVIGNKFRNKLPVTPATHRGKVQRTRDEGG